MSMGDINRGIFIRGIFNRGVVLMFDVEKCVVFGRESWGFPLIGIFDAVVVTS